jgi:tRNA dimethylallyltransferase
MTFTDSGRTSAERGCPSPTSSLVVLVGPTGSGKSALGLVLAKHFGGEVVNCDSVQVYRGLDIGSAKLTERERDGVPHHLLDVIDWREELTAGAYAGLAREHLADIARRGRVAFVVGGTGFYLRALLEGLSPAPLRDQQLRNRLSSLALRRPLALSRFLRKTDPEAAGRIHPNDLQKLIRAIEMTLLARRPASATQALPREPIRGFAILKIGLDPLRDLLYERLNARSAAIFQAGILEEVRRYLEAGALPESKPLQSLGYKQAVDVIVHRKPVSDAIAEYQVRTRQYAKRQMTWFRADPGVHWLHGFGSDPGTQRQALNLTNEFVRPVS